jgi:hypothetical protein
VDEISGQELARFVVGGRQLIDPAEHLARR